MIILVHSLYFLIKFLRNVYIQQKVIEEFRRNHDEKIKEEAAYRNAVLDIEETNSVSFDPPVCLQRYSVVQQVLVEQQSLGEIKKVVEFGCSELSFFSYLKNLYGIDEVLEVDINEDVLRESISAVLPVNTDYFACRFNPFNVQVLCGSLGDPDIRLANADAVIAIEVIEHLYPDTLDALSYNIFGYINPQIVILTTPNADFNILFPRFKGFRHYDHKFEWSREQFRDWAENQTLRFPEYSLEIKGIGEGPKGTESLGCCSQMAVFRKTYESVSNEIETTVRRKYSAIESSGVCSYYSFSKQFMISDRIQNETNSENNYYKLVDTIEYPHYEDKRSTRQKILEESMSLLYRNVSKFSRFYNKNNNCVEVPLYELISNSKGVFSTVHQIKSIFEEAQILIKECLPPRFTESILCAVYDINTDSGVSDTYSEDDESIDASQCLEDCSCFDSESDCEDDYYNQNTSTVKEAQVIVSKTLNKILKNSTEETHLDLEDQLLDSCDQIFNFEWSPRDSINYVIGNRENELLGVELHEDNINPDELDVNLDDNSEVSSSNHELDDDSNHIIVNASEDHLVLPNIDEESDDQNVILEKLIEEFQNLNEESGVDIHYEEAGDASRTEELELAVNQASLEGLYDPNSQVDMLSEYSLSTSSNTVVQETEELLADEEESIAEEYPNPFPDWLLQIFQHYDEFADQSNVNCQGDGVGVHQRFIELDRESSSSTLAGNNDDEEFVESSTNLPRTCSRTSFESSDEFYDTLDGGTGSCNKKE